MNFPAIARRPLRASATAPIRAYSRRGFVIGWLAILCLAGAAYALAASQLSASTVELAPAGQVTISGEPTATRS